MCRVLALQSPSEYWKELTSTIDLALRSLQETVCIPLHHSQAWKTAVQEATRFEALLTIAVPPVGSCTLRESRFNPQMAAVFEKMNEAQVASLVENWTRGGDQLPENDVRVQRGSDT